MSDPHETEAAYSRAVSKAAQDLQDLLNAPPEGVVVRFEYWEIDRSEISGPIRLHHRIAARCYRQLPDFLSAPEASE
ncbi:hypothetical protein [Tropicimonas marinistellae]|uniref:hypothetical protein n=1 Tax=Tropicimonas marinistellae TaxID=1739787 RepID=UPI00082FFEF3|nr:hypothetical protein [Tropicimonas marinistellae]